MRRPFVSVVVGVLVLTYLSAVALAWTNTQRQGPVGQEADWFEDTNWTSGVPGSVDYAYIDNGGIAVITGD